ncbi:hypothetical protein QE152_g30476 [Popillia japonica]|uniref:Uncharacterized protein n=1 Tax=Popillia japonica TaxID=7064 RepID=A0AAW1JDR2_POPJA
MLPSKWILRTATGKAAVVKGAADICFAIGATAIQHRVLVADIKSGNQFGNGRHEDLWIPIELEASVLKINNEELVLHPRTSGHMRVMVAENVVLRGRIETVLETHMEGDFVEGSVTMLEPIIDDEDLGRGIVVGKSLITSKKTVPVRIMNVNYYSTTLKKGTVLGWCSPVSAIVHRVEATLDASTKIPSKLNDVIVAACKGLNQKERREMFEWFLGV